jgi:hypothetical protein
VLHLHAVRQQKIGSEDVENAIQTPPARFGSPFSLILGLGLCRPEQFLADRKESSLGLWL